MTELEIRELAETLRAEEQLWTKRLDELPASPLEYVKAVQAQRANEEEQSYNPTRRCKHRASEPFSTYGEDDSLGADPTQARLLTLAQNLTVVCADLGAPQLRGSVGSADPWASRRFLRGQNVLAACRSPRGARKRSSLMKSR